VVGCFGKMSGTYWVIVIRPQLSRTATIDIGYTSNRSSLSVLNRSMHKPLAFLLIRRDLWKGYCKHSQTRSACSVDMMPVPLRQNECLRDENSLPNRGLWDKM
jgi:hypothetical protein